MRAGVFFLTFVLFSFGVTAFADPSEEDMKKAAALFEQAEKKFKISEYQAALEDYKQAYLLSDEASLLFNIAQCHRFLGNDQEAIKSYRNFLKDANPDPQFKTLAEKLIVELEEKAKNPQGASLGVGVSGAPEGVLVFIDGAEVGPPPTLKVLPAGAHTVELRKDNTTLHSEVVELKPSEFKSLSVTLQGEKAPPKQEGVLLRIQSGTTYGRYAVVLDTPGGVLSCPQEIGLVPCELRSASSGTAVLKISGTRSASKELTLPSEDSQLVLSFPKSAKPPFLVAAGGVLLVPLGISMLVFGSGGDPDGLGPKPPRQLRPGLVAGGFLVSGSSFIVVSAGALVGLYRVVMTKKSISELAFTPVAK